jgi:hypothetical protein
MKLLKFLNVTTRGRIIIIIIFNNAVHKTFYWYGMIPCRGVDTSTVALRI